MARKKSGVVIHNVEQRSPEWHELRKQYPLTGSEAQAIGNNGAGLETLIWSKLAERHSSAPKEEYTNEHMDRGVELEAQARSLYELETGRTVTEVGFVTNEAISTVGGVSPDGLVDVDGGLEIKCPADVKFFRMLVEGITVDAAYDWQVQMQLLFTGRKWWDLVLYNPNFKQSFLVVRLTPKEEMQAKIVAGLKKGEAIISEIEKQLTKSK